MNPVVQNIREVQTLNPNKQIVTALKITYMVGPHGPFTLVASPADVANGNAVRQMQAFASTLLQLPGASIAAAS